MKVFNEILEVQFNQYGSLCSIIDKRLNKKYLTEEHFSGLFRVIAPIGNWQGRHADSSYQTNVLFKRINDQELKIIYEKLAVSPRKADFDFNFSSSGVTEHNAAMIKEIENIQCVVSIKLSGEEVITQITVENLSNVTVTDVIFPVISGFGSESADMNITWPVQTQINKRIIEKPYIHLGGDNHKEWFHEKRFLQARYPLELITAWVDFSDENGGLSFDIRSAEPQIFDFCVQKVIKKDRYSKENNKVGLFMAPEFYPTIKTGCKWTSPECIIRVHNADWHRTAKEHRTWLEGVMERPETPKNFKTSLGWHFYLMKLQDGTDIRSFDDLPKMAEAAKDAGINNIMLFGLYNYGHDNDYEMSYIPNEDWGGPEKFISAVREVQEKGVRVIPFFNGTLMDSRLLKEDPDLINMCVQGRTGTRYGGQDWSRPAFDFPQTSYKGYTMTRNNMLFEVCITSEKGSKWFKDTVKRLSQDYETGNIQLDQLAHKSFVCYDENHGHKSPQTAYIDGLKALLQDIKKDLRQYNPEGIIIGEGFSDLTASYCDGFWNWNQLDNPQVVRYSVPWLRFSCEVDALDFGEANFCFANSLLFDLKIEGGVGILSDFPDFQQHLKSLAKLKEELADSYAEGDFEDQDGITVSGSSFITAKVYINRNNGKGAVIIANTQNKPAEVVIELSRAVSDVEKISFDCTRAAAERKQKFSLKPYEVNALEFKL